MTAAPWKRWCSSLQVKNPLHLDARFEARVGIPQHRSRRPASLPEATCISHHVLSMTRHGLVKSRPALERNGQAPDESGGRGTPAHVLQVRQRMWAFSPIANHRAESPIGGLDDDSWAQSWFRKRPFFRGPRSPGGQGPLMARQRRPAPVASQPLRSLERPEHRIPLLLHPVVLDRICGPAPRFTPARHPGETGPRSWLARFSKAFGQRSHRRGLTL